VRCWRGRDSDNARNHKRHPGTGFSAGLLTLKQLLLLIALFGPTCRNAAKQTRFRKQIDIRTFGYHVA
jgi:hypothetical protein